MSGRSCASGSVRSGSLRLVPAGGGAAHDFVLDALYERKRDKKSVRVLTVIIYVFCVSLAAIMLSLYYVFFWEPKDAHAAQRKVAHTVDEQTTTTPMPTCFMPYTGGSNSTVRGNQSSEEPPTVTSTQNTESEATETFPTTAEYTSSMPEETYFDKRNNTLPVAKSTTSQLLNHTKLDFNATDNT